MKHYVKNCPKCNLPLTYDDIDYNFEGNQDEYSSCPKCNLAYKFKIRYHKVCNTYMVTEEPGNYHYERFKKGD